MAKAKRKPGDEPRNGTELQMDLLRLGQAHGWLVQMSRRSQMCRTQSDAGFPDLIIIKPRRILLIECKSRYEKLSPEQVAWRCAIVDSGDDVSSSTLFGDFDQMVGWAVARPKDYARAALWIAEETSWQ